MNLNLCKRIGIIGCGVMGLSIAQQLKGCFDIHVFDKETSKISSLSDIKAAKNISALINSASTIILAIKPQDFYTVLNEISNDKLWLPQDAIFISIAAGIPTTTIENALEGARVIRVMPNIGLKIGQGVSCLAKGKYASKEDFDFAVNLFKYMGQTLRIEESLMDAATAVSGSGPGFFYELLERNHIKSTDTDGVDTFTKTIFIPELLSVAQKIGFFEEQAKFLAMSTATSSISLLKKTKSYPSELKKQVTSKGGTTEAGLEVLQKGGSLEGAVKAALKRAEELSKKEKV